MSRSSSSTWRLMPLTAKIMDILERRQGLVLDNELETILNKEYGNYSQKELNKALMSLENMGVLHVSRITKSRRSIKKVEGNMGFMAVDED
ncbi:MAG: hypothetical protein ACTSYA_11165 [Candidatus Kariarchaeaceae archaeon]